MPASKASRLALMSGVVFASTIALAVMSRMLVEAYSGGTIGLVLVVGVFIAIQRRRVLLWFVDTEVILNGDGVVPIAIRKALSIRMVMCAIVVGVVVSVGLWVGSQLLVAIVARNIEVMNGEWLRKCMEAITEGIASGCGMLAIWFVLSRVLIKYMYSVIPGHCSECGYLLAGHGKVPNAVCPECGCMRSETSDGANPL